LDTVLAAPFVDDSGQEIWLGLAQSIARFAGGCSIGIVAGVFFCLLDIAAGEFVSVVGASGCGKSTLLRLIIGLDTDYEGDILLGSRRIEGPGPERASCFRSTGCFPG
jgi:ABC-type taurine transport system ATPase subunit